MELPDERYCSIHLNQAEFLLRHLYVDHQSFVTNNFLEAGDVVGKP